MQDIRWEGRFYQSVEELWGTFNNLRLVGCVLLNQYAVILHNISTEHKRILVIKSFP